MNKLTEDEEKILKKFVNKALEAEMVQAKDLVDNCDNKYQYAKTHSVYVKDWEKTKQEMLNRLETRNLPEGTSPELLRKMINSLEQVFNKKLDLVQKGFSEKFNESIYDYIGKDGKTKGCFGVIIILAVTGLSIILIYI